jgi:arsenical pump membrane protein
VHLQALVERVGPILGFVVCITIVAELAGQIGVFRTVARGASRLAGGSVLVLWLLVALVATVSAAVLSLDTTAVLLTPVVLALARQLDLDPELFAYTAVWLANTASLFLPVSNLTNLLAVHQLNGNAGNLTPVGFAALLWPAAVVSAAVTVLAVAVVFRRSLRGRYQRGAVEPVADRPLLVLATIVAALLGPAFLAGVDVLVAAAVAAGILVFACLVRRRSLLTWRLLPWKLVVGIAVLFVLVQFAHDHGLGAVLARAAGSGVGWTDLVLLTGIGAVGANVIDNLPAYLALEPTASAISVRLAALLVGVGAGPLISPWASLATLLWAARCRAADVSVNWRTFAIRGLLLVPAILVLSVSALWFAQR